MKFVPATEVPGDDLVAVRPGFSHDAYEARLARVGDGSGEWLVAVDESLVLGWLLIEWHGKSTKPDHPDIADVFVRVECRGRGIGTALVVEAERRVAARGHEAVGLSVNPTESPDAQRLYEQLGYRHDGGAPYLDGIYDGADDWVIDLVKPLLPLQPVARGRWTDVYDLGGGRILKRYRDTTAEPIAAFEAAVLVHARAHGIPVPEVHHVNGGDLVLERIDGPTMLRDLTRRPYAMRQHARTLAELHAIVHRVPALEGLQHPFGPGEALLHLDLHPDNVILSPSGPVLIDWQGAVAGPAAADVAHTWLLLRTSVVPGPFFQRAVGSLGQRLFARTYLALVDAAGVTRALPMVAARRLQDATLLEAEATRIRRLLPVR